MTLPTLLRPINAATPDDERAFEVYAASVTGQLGVLTAAAMIVFTLAWWPLDLIVRSDPRYLDVFATVRWRALAVESAALAAFLGWPWARRHAIALAPLFFGAFLAGVGEGLGRLGGVDLGYLGDASLGVVPIAFVPMRLPRRFVATAFVGVAMLAGFFLPHPANRLAPGAAAQVSFVAFAVLFSLTVGELSTRVTRHAFFQRRALDAANAALATLTDSLATQVADRTAELRTLAQHLDGALESERRRIARDLHDDLGQRLTALRYAVARFEDGFSPDDADAHARLEDLHVLLDGAASTTREVITELRPRVLDDVGLLGATRWLCARAGETGAASVSLDAEGFPDGVESPSSDVALCLFRVAQESLNNALRHSNARSVEVSLRREGARFTLAVRDDGDGFDPSRATQGFGLLGMRERLRAAGGGFELRAAPGRGTTVTATLTDAPEARGEA